MYRPPRLVPALLAGALMAAAASYAALRASDTIAVADDPVQITDRALGQAFNAQVATREIDAALAAGDSELAQSFVELAAARHVRLAPELIERTNAAVAEAATTRHKLVSFTRGLVTGVPDDGAALAGTATGDLFMFGDIRDAVRETAHLASGEKADELVLGLACVGIAITAGTYASFGAAAPARAGLTLGKAARKAGSVSAELAANVGRMLRGVVDWGALRNISITQPALAVRTAREAVKIERAGGLLHLARDVARVEEKAGARAALDGLKIAEKPADMGRFAKLAEKEGSRTRAIVKLLGRGAIWLAGAALDIAVWMLGAAFALFGFISSLKGATERITWRILQRRKRRRLQIAAAALPR